MKLIVIFLSIFIFTGCNNMLRMTSSQCENYFEMVKQTWPKKIDGYYNLVDLDKVFTKEKDCLIGKSREEILKLFGEPSKAKAYYYHYYLKKECTQQRNQGGCITLSFGFNQESGKVVIVQEPFIWLDNIQ